MTSHDDWYIKLKPWTSRKRCMCLNCITQIWRHQMCYATDVPLSYHGAVHRSSVVVHLLDAWNCTQLCWLIRRWAARTEENEFTIYADEWRPVVTHSVLAVYYMLQCETVELTLCDRARTAMVRHLATIKLFLKSDSIWLYELQPGTLFTNEVPFLFLLAITMC